MIADFMMSHEGYELVEIPKVAGTRRKARVGTVGREGNLNGPGDLGSEGWAYSGNPGSGGWIGSGNPGGEGWVGQGNP